MPADNQGTCGFCGATIKQGDDKHTHNIVGTTEQNTMPVPPSHKYKAPPARVTSPNPDAGTPPLH